jgi:hypothetical protein
VAELHVGTDAGKTVVSAYPLRTRTGRARRRRTGSVTEFLPVAPSGRVREVRVAFLARLSLPVLFAAAVLFAVGVPTWLLGIGVVAALALVGRRDHRASRRATFEAPRDPDARVLRTPEERAAYARAVSVSRRVRATWPALAGMIDPVDADRALTDALDGLATLLVRRQEIRRLRAGLDDVRPAGLPADSPAVLALAAQRERTEELWLATADQANRILRAIDAAAVAGETFVHEQRIGTTARRTEAVLARLTAGAPPTAEAPELAERTDTVLAAYRDLARE